ncbi:uncharacterized protein ARMOST_17486 [Armillaria ostoyae]|uniref:Uncharacterized protein n=1 Tax=Armillaria ostoyae TaxID=47428 RepID=A0A284RZ48_ARMOS|nr:uncharacterized protein ARMOST_17486 [Armillaria ostoyae]
MEALDSQRREIGTSIAFQTALSTPLPPASAEEHQILHCEPYNDSAVSCLPVEMLGEIFQLVVDGDLGSAEYNVLDVKHSSNWVISHVCRVWRSASVLTPSLWASVCIADDLVLLMLDDVPFNNNRATLLQEYLARSGQYPLLVTLSSPSADIQKYLETLLPHLDRCTDLSFTINGEALNTLSTFSGEFSGLKGLSIVIDFFHSTEPSSTTADIDCFRKAPNLQEVSLHGIGVLHLKLPFSQLQSFTGDIFRYIEYLELFLLASQLITATLKVCFVPPIYPLPAPFSHTKLRTLSLYNDIKCIRDLRLPALEVFRIERISSGGCHHIAKLFRDSHCPLRSLYLEVSGLLWRELDPILKACSSTLISLSIRVNVESARYVYNALDGTSCLAPRLEELCVREDYWWEGMELSFADHAFLNMVFWRRGSDNGEVAVLKSLTMCAPYAPRPDDALRKLQELEEGGLKVEFYDYPWKTVI